MSQKDLQKLFFSIHSEDEKIYKDEFKKIAKQLINSFQISAGQNSYCITEIEFYLFTSNEQHQDIYSHQHKAQLQSGFWYAHPSGIDITFGNEEKGNFGGILLRGIRNTKTNEFTSGPMNVRGELIRNLSIFENDGLLLKERSEPQKKGIFQVKRIGLNRQKESKPYFHDLPYRFLTDIDQTAHKFKDKTKVANELFETGQTKKDLLEEWFWNGVLS